MRLVLFAILSGGCASAQSSPRDQRVADLTDAITRKPDFGAAYFARGVTRLELRKYADAAGDFTKSLELTPNDANAYARRGEAYSSLSRYEEAIADLTAAIGIKPGNTGLYLRRADAFRLSGRCDSAIPDYDKGIAALPSAEAFRGRSACRRQLGDTAGAEDDEVRAGQLSASMSAVPPPRPPVNPPGKPPGPPPGQPRLAEPAEGGKAYRIGAGVSAPSLIFRWEPEYSEEARKAKGQGSVMLSLIVDEFGGARDIKVIRALGMGLDQEAIKAVQRWVFKPGLKDGAPVPVYATIEVTFHLL